MYPGLPVAPVGLSVHMRQTCLAVRCTRIGFREGGYAS